MGLALFDLDNTLIAGDSDHLWGDFLVSQGRVDATEHKALNTHFYDQYKNGELNIDEYLTFALGPMTGMTKETLAPLQQQFVRDHIEPILLDAAFALLEQHRALGDTLVIITATNTLVTQPIADRLGVEHLIGCEAEIIEGCYTGKPTGVPSFAKGKVARMQTWFGKSGRTRKGHMMQRMRSSGRARRKATDHRRKSRLGPVAKYPGSWANQAAAAGA